MSWAPCDFRRLFRRDSVAFGTSTKTTVGESNVSVEAIITDYNNAAINTGYTAGEADVTWATLNQNAAKYGISVADSAIKSLAKSIQSVGDFNARLSSKEESLSFAVSNTEATRSRIEDADFAKVWASQQAFMKEYDVWQKWGYLPRNF